MKARLIISIGFFLSNLHRFWNNSEPVEVWFPLFKSFPITFQWYVFLLFSKLFPVFILIAAYLGIRKKDYTFIGLLFALEIVNYVIWYSESEIILFIQGALLLYIYLREIIKWK